jgi:uncharacterized protein YbcI
MSAQDRTQAGSLTAVTRRLVRLHHQYYGKGPTKARSYMVDDTLIAILEGGFAAVEQTLIAEGKAEAVHDMRRSFQLAMEERFRGAVEEATGRRVIAYMSQIHTDPDLAVELFVLEPTMDDVVAEHHPEFDEREGRPATD